MDQEPDIPPDIASHPLHARRPGAWPLLLMVQRLEAPLADLKRQARLLRQTMPGAGMNPTPGGPAETLTGNLADDAGWFQARLGEMEKCARGLESAVNINLANAVSESPRSAAKIEDVCAEILRHCSSLLDIERRILARNIHAGLKARQSALAGISSDIIGEHQDCVTSMRHFIEQENEDNQFVFNLNINFDRLLAVPPPLPSLVPAAPAGKARSSGSSCALWLVIIIVGGIGSVFLPFWGLLLLLFFVYLLGKSNA